MASNLSWGISKEASNRPGQNLKKKYEKKYKIVYGCSLPAVIHAGGQLGAKTEINKGTNQRNIHAANKGKKQCARSLGSPFFFAVLAGETS